MNKEIDKYVSRKNKGIGVVATTELKELKRELVHFLHENDNGFVIHEFFKGYDNFANYIDRLFGQNLSSHSIETIRAMSYVSKIDKYDLEFMMKYL